MKRLNIVGEKFNRLTVLRNVEPRNGQTFVQCKCDCGNIGIHKAAPVKSGDIKSCGCLQKEVVGKFMAMRKTHGMRHTKTYSTWAGMIQRCSNPKYRQYKNYGGRGIKVCDRWMKFENFYKDMGDRPKNRSLDRINNNGNYEQGNCRWATNIEQGNNKRNNIRIKFYDMDLTLSEWSRAIGISIPTLWYRIFKFNWPISKALTTQTKC